MKKIYIARQVFYGDFSSEAICEESIFDSYKKAKNYINTLVDNNPKKEEIICFRNEILEYPLNEKRGYPIKTWIYAVDGRLLREIDHESETSQSDFSKFDYKQKYSVGDLVFVASEIDNLNSYSVKGEYAIVWIVPVSKEDWLARGKDKDDWDGNYIVVYITPEGIANHMHVPECVLKKLDVHRLPKELSFLKEYSDHLKGIKSLPKKLVNELLEDRVYLKKTKNYY